MKKNNIQLTDEELVWTKSEGELLQGQKKMKLSQMKNSYVQNAFRATQNRRDKILGESTGLKTRSPAVETEGL